MVLSIIIVSWNVRDLLRKCLASIGREMRLPPERYEVIVVDNASSDGSAEVVRNEFPSVKLIASPTNLGFGAGCNLGYKAAAGEFVLLFNPDAEVIDHAVDGMLEVMRTHPGAGIIAPRLVNEDRSFQSAAGGAFFTLGNVAWHFLFLKDVLPSAVGPSTLFLEGDPRGLVSIDWVSGAAMMLRRAAVGEQIFDEDFFMFGEDMDLCGRLRDRGWEVLYSGKHSVVHHHGRSFDKAQSVDVLASAYGGPRRAFRKRHGALQAFIYDAIMLAGYSARWPLFWMLSVFRPGRGYEARSRFSRNYLRAILRGP